MQKSLTQVEADLQGLLDEVGVDEFPVTKALYLKDVQIVDAEGKPIDAEDVDLEIELKAEEEEAEEKMEMEDDEDKVYGHDDEERKAVEEEEEKADEDDERETKALEDEDSGEMKPRQRLRIGVGVKPGSRGGQPTSLRNPLTGETNPQDGRRGRKSVAEEAKAAVDKTLNKNKIKSKGFDMRIDNEREGLKRWGSLKHISRVASCADQELEAYRIGRWAAACMGHKKSQDYCANHGIETKAHLETVNSQGGFLVPEEFSNTLISLREEYGVFRRNAKIEPMTSDTKRIPKRSATLTAHFVGEATAGTESDMNFQSVQLVAKKLMVLTSVSSELQEDALLNLGDSVAGECAYAQALKEDQCGFMGTGTSEFGGIVGIINAMNNVSSNAGVTVLGSTDRRPSNITIGDFHNMMGTLPPYADTPRAKFYMHKSIWNGVCESLIYAVGGASAREIQQGSQGTTFLGYPVEFTQVMPDITTGSTGADGDASDQTFRFPIIFGDLSLGCAFGDRRQNTIAFSDSALNAFEQDEIIVRGTERFDIQCHSPGTSAEAGPVVGMKLD
tara:strand:+ start:84 stop:1760 length:1677 start_codon:yes stop_codon:yes gene_type:complete